MMELIDRDGWGRPPKALCKSQSAPTVAMTYKAWFAPYLPNSTLQSSYKQLSSFRSYTSRNINLSSLCRIGIAMGSAIEYLDSMLIPSSLLVMLGYHAYLWHHLKLNPRRTTIGIHSLRRREWFLQLQGGDEKKGMLAVQSLRNTLMTTIFTATVTILMTLGLAALCNMAYYANTSTNVFSSPIFGSRTERMVGLKYGSAMAVLLGSFVCSSIATGLLIDCNYIVMMESWSWKTSSGVQMLVPAQQMLARAYGLAVVGNRMLGVGFATALWLLGPAPVALASLALVWGFYHLDFPPR